MKAACIVLAHRGPEQLGHLLSALRDPGLQLYLHLDSRTRLEPFRETLRHAAADGTVMLRRRRARWGGPEVVDATVEGLARGMQDGCQYFLLISGQDFPIRPVGEILAFLEKSPSTSYLEHWPIPTARWRFGGRDRTDFYTYNLLGRRETCIPAGEDTSFLNWRGHAVNRILRLRTLPKPPRQFPRYARPVGGTQWWNLSGEAARCVLSFLAAHPDYRRYHDYTLLPDELFFQSILLGTDVARATDIVTDDLRYASWASDSSHPRTLTEADLPALLQAHDLFARKFDLQVDRNVLLDLLERLRQ